MFGAETEAMAERRRLAQRRAAAHQAIDQAMADGDHERAARLLDLFTASVTETDRAPLAPTEPTPRPELPPVNRKAARKAATAARKAAARQTAQAASADAARKAQATVALVVTTLAARRSDPGQGNQWPDQPFAGLRGRNVKPAGLAGSFLRARFLDDPRLTPDEAAVAIMALIAAKRGPVLLTHQTWDRVLGAGRNGPHRTAEQGGRPWQELYDGSPGGRGWVDVPLGLTRFDPTDDDTTDLTDSDTDVDEVPTWIGDPTDDDD